MPFYPWKPAADANIHENSDSKVIWRACHDNDANFAIITATEFQYYMRTNP
jgi:hypothetical protein